MMNEQEDSMMNPESVQSGDDHICTDADMCTADQPNEHLDVASLSEFPAPEQKQKKRIGARHIAAAVVGLVVVVVGGMSAFVYTHAASDKTVRAITTRLPFPAILVGRKVVTFKQYYSEEESLKKYFASTVSEGGQAPTDAQLNEMISQTLVNKAVIEKFASDYGVVLDPKKVEAFYQSFIQSNPGATEDSIKKQLQDTFGWTPEQFKMQIVRPITLSSEVGDYVAKSPFFQEPLKAEIDSAYKRVTTGGEDFEKVGNEVHQKVQVELESDLGFIKQSELPATWGDKVKDLEKGKVTEIVELPQGYAIFKVTDRIKSQEVAGKKADPKAPADDQIHLLTITVPKKTLDQVVQQYLKQVTPKTLIKL